MCPSHTRGLRRRRSCTFVHCYTAILVHLANGRTPINGACRRRPPACTVPFRAGRPRASPTPRRGVTAAASNSVKHFDEGGRLLIRRKKGRYASHARPTATTPVEPHRERPGEAAASLLSIKATPPPPLLLVLLPARACTLSGEGRASDCRWCAHLLPDGARRRHSRCTGSRGWAR